MSATIKENIRRYVNEGNDCENSLQFIQGAKTTSHTTVIGGRLIYDNAPEQKAQWTGIKKFNNVLYEVVDNLRGYHQSTANTVLRATVWRAFGIGAGKQCELREKVVSLDRIEIVGEHINNEWKFDGLPCHHRGTHQVFL